MSKSFKQVCEEIENGKMTIDEINNTDWDFGDEYDDTYVQDRAAYFDTYQMALKIAMNSLYGALANTYFLLFNRDVAASITGNGRIFIQGLANYINGRLQKALKTNKNFVIYGDTDSVVGDTLIKTKKFGKTKISHYFDYIEGFVEERDPNNLVKYITEEDETLSASKDGILNKNKINYVMKHKVKKRLYNISIHDNSVTVTEDHSIMVKRNGEITEVKPTEIEETDFLIKLIWESEVSEGEIYFTNDFSVEDLGVQEEWVYDIEVENDHNFFGNGICVHNSCYFTLDKLVEKFDTEDNHDILDKLINFDKKYLDVWVQEYIDQYADTFNAFNKDPIGAKLEKIADKGMFVAKKKYALRAIWDEGAILLNNPKLAVTGLEIVRSSTPAFCRKYLKEMVEVILDNDAKTTIDKLGEIEEEFYKASIDDIARVSGIGSLDYVGHIGKYTTFKNNKTLTAPMNVRAAMNYNLFLDETNLDKYPKITDADKIKYIFLKKPNILGDDVIAFLDSDFIEDSKLLKYIDRERMWEDFFISPLKLMLEAVGYDLDQNFDIEEWM